VIHQQGPSSTSTGPSGGYQLQRHADVAKDQAKAETRAGTSANRNALDPLHQISLTARLRRALAQHPFVLHYQPLARGCRLGQGFLFSRPVPAARISARYGTRQAA
jgi:hypothetical protein